MGGGREIFILHMGMDGLSPSLDFKSYGKLGKHPGQCGPVFSD